MSWKFTIFAEIWDQYKAIAYKMRVKDKLFIQYPPPRQYNYSGAALRKREMEIYMLIEKSHDIYSICAGRYFINTLRYWDFNY